MRLFRSPAVGGGGWPFHSLNFFVQLIAGGKSHPVGFFLVFAGFSRCVTAEVGVPHRVAESGQWEVFLSSLSLFLPASVQATRFLKPAALC